MYNSQEVAERVKNIAKDRGIKVTDMLADCELGVNTISKMAKGTDILSKNLAKIADYLNVSIDYLLGKTDKKNQPTENSVLTEQEQEWLRLIRAIPEERQESVLTALKALLPPLE